MNGFRAKTFANTYIYTKKDENGKSTEQELVNFIVKSSHDKTRINKGSTAFIPIKNMVKERQKTAVLYRVLMDPDTVLVISPTGKELPSSFKVFYSVDLASPQKKKRLFIDVTGLIKEKNGYFSCRSIDTLCAYLFAAVVIGTYYEDTMKITGNATIVKTSANCFTKMFCGVLDQMRVVNYNENRVKIAYIVAMYYLYSIVQKDLDSAKATAIGFLSMNAKDANAYDIYYDEEKDFKNIDTFVTFLAETFKLKGLNTNNFMNSWLRMYGNGSLYAAELMPSFLTTITNAYSGAYINRQNIIENMCGKDMVTLSEMLLRVGAETFNKGFNYDNTGVNPEMMFTENLKIEKILEEVNAKANKDDVSVEEIEDKDEDLARVERVKAMKAEAAKKEEAEDIKKDKEDKEAEQK